MKKNILFLLCIILAVTIIVLGTDIQSVDEYYLLHIDDITESSETVFLSIQCKSILENMDNLDPALKTGGYVPDNGVILPKTQYVLRSGDTVFTVLYRAVRHHKIQFAFQGAGQNSFGTAYIQGLHNIFEYDCGPLSGWMFRVNGEFPTEGISDHQLQNGDYAEIIYSCDLGRDIETGNKA